MIASPQVMEHGKAVRDLAGRLAGGDAGEQLHILLQAVATFAASYTTAPALLQIAINTLTAARDTAAEFTAEKSS